MKQSPLVAEFDRLLDSNEDLDLHLMVMEALSAMMRRVGFSQFYSSGEEVLQHAIEICREELELARQDQEEFGSEDGDARD